MKSHYSNAFEWSIFILRTIKNEYDTVEAMLREDLQKTFDRICEKCHRDLSCDTERKFVNHPDGFVVSINRGMLIPEIDQNGDQILDDEGYPKMIKVSPFYDV